MPDSEVVEVECDNCGCLVDEHDMSRTRDGYDVCDDCHETCEWCDGTFMYLSDHQDYRCESCDTDFCTYSDYSYCDDCERYFCPDCNCDCSEYSGSIHSWDWRPRTYRPKGEWRTGGTLLGLELEVGHSASQIVPAVQAIDDNENHLYMKQDGSIQGVEIVSHPATLEWSRDFPYDNLLQLLRRNGCYVDDGYGLHVHVSRNAFRSSPAAAMHQMTWLMFMYRNTDALEILARRSSDRWASFQKPGKGELKRKAARPDDRSSRYVAVNCNNERTYELRFFGATLKDQEFWAALEFADASVKYTKVIKTHDILRGSALTWDKFETWVGSEDYPNLLAEMAKF